MRKPKTPAETGAIILVSLVTVIHITMHIAGGFSWSYFTSLIGALFIATFFLNKRIYGSLILSWVIMQLVVINFPTSSGQWDLAQIVSLHFGFQFNISSGGEVVVGVNPVGIFYLILAAKVNLDAIYGKKFKLVPLKKETVLDQFLPAEMEVLKRVRVGEEKSWYLVKLVEKDNFALVRGKDEMFLKSGKKMILKYLVVHEPGSVLNVDSIPANQFTQGAWAVIP